MKHEPGSKPARRAVWNWSRPWASLRLKIGSALVIHSEITGDIGLRLMDDAMRDLGLLDGGEG